MVAFAVESMNGTVVGAGLVAPRGRHGVAVMDYPASELQDDLGNA
jgi:hypothetical protein